MSSPARRHDARSGERLTYYQQAGEILVDDVPGPFLYNLAGLFVVNPAVTGYPQHRANRVARLGFLVDDHRHHRVTSQDHHNGAPWILGRSVFHLFLSLG